MSEDDFGLMKAYITSLFLESTFFGVYLVSFCLCIRYLVWERCPEFELNKRPNWKFIIVTLLLLILTTMHVSCALARTFQAPNSERSWVDIIVSLGIGMAVVTVDAILIYRCWIIYMKRWIVIALPVLVWTGSVIITIYSAVKRVRSYPQEVPSPDAVRRFAHEKCWIIFLALTIFQNILTTALIAWRITIVDRESSQYRIQRKGSRCQRSVRLIIESGSLCTLAACLAFITFLSGGKFGLIAADLEIQLVSIAFNLIIIRSANRSSDEYNPSQASSGSIRLHELFRRSQQSIIPTSNTPESSTLPKPLEVCITNEILKSRDSRPETIKP
ncbi:hypothetical protein EDD18DRAFT_1347957 [Armillaria luteobubalina]|uniref:Uncharacterized protein n=1 Tax=Armillaria luteobubalina TaxID=153913 RepID=A0AA39QFC5_9AGAR|nr:hypothetical protein EDD18DRAFT_1347957 [Armillaria luteobubalina]